MWQRKNLHCYVVNFTTRPPKNITVFKLYATIAQNNRHPHLQTIAIEHGLTEISQADWSMTGTCSNQSDSMSTKRLFATGDLTQLDIFWLCFNLQARLQSRPAATEFMNAQFMSCRRFCLVSLFQILHFCSFITVNHPIITKTLHVTVSLTPLNLKLFPS